MTQPVNTPLDGDFVRYIENLTAANAAVQNRLQTQRNGQKQPGAVHVPGEDDGLRTFQPLGEAFNGASLWRHLRWVVALWIAAKVLASVPVFFLFPHLFFTLGGCW